MPERSPVTVIWNPSSRAAAQAEQMRLMLRDLPDVSIEEPKDAAAAQEVIQELAHSPGLLVAAGGDGTVRATLDSMVSTKSKRTLAILPLGTGNDLARSLGIPLDNAGALRVMQSGVPRAIDLLKFTTDERNGISGNMITGGNTGRYLDVMTDEIKARWGVFCYLRGVIDVIQNLEAYEITLTLDDGPPETIQALNVFIANGRTSGGGMVVSPDARVDDGLADVLVVRDGDPGAIAGLTANYFLSDHREHDLITFHQARRIRLQASPQLLLTADGDSVGGSPLEVEVLPRAIQVLIAEG